MIEDFFNKLLVPEFLKVEFQKDNWYLLIANFKKILGEQFKSGKLTANFKSDNNPKISIKGQVHIGKNSIIGDFVTIEGPVYIGDDVEINPGAYIRPGSIICDTCSIGFVANVKNALMMSGSKVANHVFLGDSIIGANARLGGHCETGNRRFDQQQIEFIYRDNKLHTGLDKLGLILGEGSRLGGDVITSPGTMIGKNTFIAMGSTISGFIEPNKFIKTESQYKVQENKFSGELKHSNLFDQV